MLGKRGRVTPNMRETMEWLRKAGYMAPAKPILELQHTGDPYGYGFEAHESRDGGHTWFYRGDLGVRTRAFWRAYARRNHFTLREVK